MKRKNILYVGNALSSSGNTLTHIESLSQDLRFEGYNVVVTSNKKNKILRMVAMIVTFFREYNSVDYVLIDTYSTTNFWYAVIIGHLCRMYNKSYIPILHGGNLPSRLEKNSKVSRKFFDGAHINVAPSDYLLNAFVKAKFFKLIKIPNSIRLSLYPFHTRKILRPKLLWVRSFTEIYNPMMAIYILEELLKIYPEASLSMVGPEKDGSLEKCKAYIAAKKLPVNFTGKLSKKDWVLHSLNSDIFINTTNYDNTPVSVIEAMALGLPIVSTNVGGIPFLINNSEDGILVPRDNVMEFKKSIEFLIKNPTDAYVIAKKARSKVEAYDWERVKELWNRLLY
ncbi:glycosyltransferase family 4 protein [Dokdonia sp. Hel_I_53]|uniref:glycosyltransferase family 4 protein n=1 Tax=Dokdonia sp. Hel_I_53 TaxID=1566287 RepID=UPI0011991785|nr:glycosyltransferase family 4 protein [Dokdonia sp. Hel_I_53]TVZ53404.1 glycosyltransferase involved in cell wall biosynthesis [Dokdonia sp. Hel_I_53]